MPRRSSRQSRDPEAPYRGLPAISRLLAAPAIARLAKLHGTELVTDLVREELAVLRERIREGRLDGAGLSRRTRPGEMAEAVARAAAAVLEPRPRAVINATGVVVHTNLGRAILSETAARQVAQAARGYLDLEYDLESGSRGNRTSHLEAPMRRLFPGRAFTVVNNNAAAVMLCLRALAKGKDVLVSRGELVEIGGSFRIPEILSASGARLCEVGTTNRTRLADFERALSPKTGMILKVHTSNFKIVGFTEETSVKSLAALARKADLPLVVDWGSGDLVDLAPLGIEDELPVARVLEQGADLVTFSGDKLLGGPQSGFVVGREELVLRVKRDPLARVVRLDRLRIGALHQTLAAYVSRRAFEEVPVLRMIRTTPAEIERRAARVKREVGRRTGLAARLALIDGVSRTGGGSSPTGERPTRLLRVAGDASALERRLRGGTPPVVARVQDGHLLLDLRTVLPEQDEVLANLLCSVLGDIPLLPTILPRPPARSATRPSKKRIVGKSGMSPRR